MIFLPRLINLITSSMYTTNLILEKIINTSVVLLVKYSSSCSLAAAICEKSYETLVSENI